MGNVAKEYPKTTLAVVLFAVWALINILSDMGGAWGVFSDDPLAQVLGRLVPTMTAEIYWWLKLLIHIAILTFFGMILSTLRR